LATKAALDLAKYNKKDEFYTLYKDIDNELSLYTNCFKGKIVYCNCDNPKCSNFWKYFYNNFKRLHLKKLIATYYNPNGSACAWEYEGSDKPLSVTPLLGNGDFASDECIEYLKQADIVVTNPPFSKFREYIALLTKYHKKFIVWANQNAITYKQFFPLLMNHQAWVGGIANKIMTFRVPEGYKYNQRLTNKINDGHYYAKINMITTFTNLILSKQTDDFKPIKHYNLEDNPNYDNYPAFEVAKVNDLPVDNDIITYIPLARLPLWQDFYQSDLEILDDIKPTINLNQSDYNPVKVRITNPVYGVPITALAKFNNGSYMSKHYNILGQAKGSDWDNINKIPTIAKYLNVDGFKSIDGEVRQIEHHRNRDTGPAIMLKEPPVGTYYVDPTIDGYIKILYSRLLIRYK
jgi:hypothetical protein